MSDTSEKRNSNLEARREARRQKILANAEQRLQRITSPDGNDDTDYPRRPSTVKFTLAVAEVPAPKAHSHKISSPDESGKTIYFNTSLDENLSTIYNPSTVSDVPPVQVRNRFWRIAAFALIHRYVLWALEPYLVLFGVELKDFYLDKVFLPFGIYEVIDLRFFSSVPQSQMFLMALLRVTLQYPKGQRFVQAVNYVIAVGQDLFWYFFCFCCANALTNLLWQTPDVDFVSSLEYEEEL